MPDEKRKLADRMPNSPSRRDRLIEQLRLSSIDSPFERLSRLQADQARAALGRENQDIYNRTLRQLRADLLQTDPIRMLSNLAVSFLFHPEGTDLELARINSLLPMHLELIQALALKH